MSITPLLIAPLEVGMIKNLKPWLTPDNAFRNLINCYLYKTRVRKRFGSHLLGGSLGSAQLQYSAGMTDEEGKLSIDIQLDIGQAITIDGERFTIQKVSPFQYSPSSSAITLSYTENKLNIEGAPPSTSVGVAPGLPVQGLILRETGELNFEDTVAFDTRKSYKHVGNKWQALGGDNSWTGDDTNFFWGVNYRGENAYQTYLYVVNYVAADGIKYLPNDSDNWVTMKPKTSDGELQTARLLIGFRDRLIALNTKETCGGGLRVYPSRARWSQFGDPRNPEVSWLDARGRGDFRDAPTRQQIIGARIIKGHLIVYFERSTWELQYTGYDGYLFEWKEINSELGCESTFSTVPFDESVLAVGNVGIHACNGVAVGRIDKQIPKEVYKIHSCCASVERVHGIRDFVQEMVYWTVPYHRGNSRFPNRILAYNYVEKAYSYFFDSFTCFGYHQRRRDITWRNAKDFYPNWRSAKESWQSGKSRSAFPDIIAGNQQGIVFVIDPQNNTNAPSLVVTSVDGRTVKIMNHNLTLYDYIRFESTGKIVKINQVVDEDQIVVDEQLTSESAGDMVRRVSNWYVKTKQFNPGSQSGNKFSFPHIDFLLDVTENGQMTVDYIINAGQGSNLSQIALPDTLYGNMDLWSKPEEIDDWTMIEQEYAWHRYFPQAQGSFIQLIITMNDRQMRDWSISSEEFVLHGFILYVTGRGVIV